MYIICYMYTWNLSCHEHSSSYWSIRVLVRILRNVFTTVVITVLHTAVQTPHVSSSSLILRTESFSHWQMYTVFVFHRPCLQLKDTSKNTRPVYTALGNRVGVFLPVYYYYYYWLLLLLGNNTPLVRSVGQARRTRRSGCSSPAPAPPRQSVGNHSRHPAYTIITDRDNNSKT